MHIKSLTIINFGPIEDYKIDFMPKGLNIIVGNSATGKTQIYGSILSLIQGKKVLTLDSDSDEISNIALVSEHLNDTQRHEYMYREKAFSCVFQNITTSENIIFSPTTSQLLSFKPTFYNGEHDISLKYIDIKYISSLLENEPFCLENWSLLQKKYLSPLHQNDKEKIVITSRGSEQILKLLAVISYHSKLSYSSPLLLDEVLDFLDEKFFNFIFLILKEYAQKNQVILFSQYKYPYRIKKGNVSEYYLTQWRKEYRSPIGYNYSSSRNKHFPVEHDRKNEIKENPLMIVRYIVDSIFNDEEYRFVEFKEVKGNNPIDSILSLVDQYVVAYLNENSKNRGQIFWGITDSERKVVGINLNYKQRDELRRRISEKLGLIQPSLPPSVYKINIEKIYNDQLQEIADLCIVEISVEPYQNNYLYSTSKGEVYIKTDGGKKKLSALELQQEILLRRKN